MFYLSLSKKSENLLLSANFICKFYVLLYFYNDSFKSSCKGPQDPMTGNNREALMLLT